MKWIFTLITFFSPFSGTSSPKMAKGIVLPQLKTNMSLTRATQRPVHMDKRDTIEWSLPPINPHNVHTLNNGRPTRVIGVRNKRKHKINRRNSSDAHFKHDNDTRPSSDYEGNNTKTIYEIEDGRGKQDVSMDMFNRMSTEAQEAYNETLQEMQRQNIGDKTTVSEIYNTEAVYHDVIPAVEALSTQIVTTEQSDKTNTGTNSESDYVNIKAADTPDITRRHRNMRLPRLLPRVTQSEPANKRSKKKRRRETLRNVPVIESKAPFSHTAARMGRKKMIESSAGYDEISLAKPASLIGSGKEVTGMERAFEITPMGYDARYNHLQAINAQHSEDEDELVEFVLQQATMKCQHWLDHQTIE